MERRRMAGFSAYSKTAKSDRISVSIKKHIWTLERGEIWAEVIGCTRISRTACKYVRCDNIRCRVNEGQRRRKKIGREWAKWDVESAEKGDRERKREMEGRMDLSSDRATLLNTSLLIIMVFYAGFNTVAKNKEQSQENTRPHRGIYVWEILK